MLVGRIEQIERVGGSDCRVGLGVFPDSLDQIPENVGAQVRAKTIFGEKWVEILYPKEPAEQHIAQGDTIPQDRTIDPLEVETILNIALPLLEAIDPEHLAGALNALVEGFVGHEDAAIRAMESGIEALKPVNENERLLKEGIRQLRESGEVFNEVDEDLLQSFENLDKLNRFTARHSALIAENLRKAPALLQELSQLFETRFEDFVEMVNRGATVVGVLAARSGDLDRLLEVLPRFNAAWIRNLNYTCRYRQPTDEPGKQPGDRVPGRCWRVHNLNAESRGPYRDGGPKSSGGSSNEDFRQAGLTEPTRLGRLLYAPAVALGGRP